MIHESRGGTTRKTAEAIADALRVRGADAVMKSLAQVTDADVKGADLIVLGSWVEGFVLFGVGPTKATQAWLGRVPQVDGTPAAIFCTYAFNPKDTLVTLARGLSDRGAQVVGQRAFHRARNTEGVGVFADSILEGAKAASST